MDNPASGKIGIFDSGYGGLTILDSIRALLPKYDYLYLGDNARSPYGTRSFEVVYDFTLQGVKKLYSMGCKLTILACNTASAKALRSIQQNDLQNMGPQAKVLGVIRPTTEIIGRYTVSRHVGLFGTVGTVQSRSYDLEIAKFFPDIQLSSVACPLWVPLIENGEAGSPGADYFVKKYCEELLSKDSGIDCVILACTHYPLLENKIRKYLPEHIRILSQGPVVAAALQNYLVRHKQIEESIGKNGTCRFYTTEQVPKFNDSASIFLKEPVEAIHIRL